MVKKSIRFSFTGLLLAMLFSGSFLAGQPQLFITADQCMACHNGLSTPTGEDVSIGLSWRPTMMANAARDPYWQAAVRREVLDHAQARTAIEDKCSTCHMPMARFQAHLGGQQGEVFSSLPIGASDQNIHLLAADGASCTMCHQISAEDLGTEESFTGGFKVDTSTQMGQRWVFGPFEVDEGRQRIMQSASGFQPRQALHLESSEFCASCHTLYTHALGPEGEVLGELPEQVPYLEWRHSAYQESRQCQSCHMQKVEGKMPISSVLGEPRDRFSRHSFRGGNFLMPRIFNLYRHQLGVTALPQELESSSRQTLQHLEQDSAAISVSSVRRSNSYLEVDVAVQNRAGHKLPTAYPSRRVWIHFLVRDGSDRVIFESGSFRKDGSIKGNDNDSEPSLYEPHFQKIESPDEVQIYEAIMVDHKGEVTTGLLSGLRYVKDNRLLPQGFDKSTAHSDVAVHGNAASDTDFKEDGDRIVYRVNLADTRGPHRIEAELWYQPISFRWAQNLGSYDASEPKRFLSYYEALSGSSSAMLARTETTLKTR